jgi:ribonuclease III family protein
MKPELMNGNTLAFLGDAVLTLKVRELLISRGITHTKKMQEQSIKVVSASAQATFMQSLIKDQWLTEEEMNIYKRGRNYKPNSKAKNVDILSYKQSTGFEALLGYWYLTKNETRLQAIWDKIETTL